MEQSLTLDTLTPDKSRFKYKSYWNNKLSSYEHNQYFNDFRTSKKDGARNWQVVEKIAHENVYELLHKVSTANNAKHIILLSALGVLAQKVSSIKDVCLLTPVYDHLEQQMVINRLIPVRMNEFSTDFRHFIQRIKETFLEGVKHANFPLQNIFDSQAADVKQLSWVVMILEGLQQMDNDIEPDVLFSFAATRELTVKIKYDAEQFNESYINQIANLYFSLLEQLLTSKESKLSEIELISSTEKSKILNEFNATDKPFPHDKTVVDLFKEQCRKFPDQTAVKFKRVSLTYQQLDSRSNQVANQLIRIGVKKGDTVAVMLDRSIELPLVIFGILKAGGVYMPISKDYPDERILYSLRNSGCKVMFCKRDDAARFQEEFNCINISEMDSEVVAPEINHSAPNLTAYLIYTSGSTGKPKGVLIRHQSLVNRLHWMQSRYPLGEKDIILQKTPTVFDVSVWELFWWSITGSTMVLAEPGMEREPHELARIVEEENVTVMHFVPSMLRAFLEWMHSGERSRTFKSLKRVFASGEELTVSDAQKFLSRLPHVGLHNLYGPTEATVDVSYYDVEGQLPKVRVPIGKPIDNTQLLVFNDQMQLQPVGVAGELYIGGVNLAIGYVNQPELTRERFVVHPFAKDKKLYRTGDLARWMTDGNIDFLGRIDNQVKIRGNRIELEEIEHVIKSYPNIRQVIVLPKASSSGYQLASFIIGDDNISADEIQHYLTAKLPAYMIPSYFVMVDEIPVTINGKVDRKKLISRIDSQQQNQYVPPVTELEKKLCEIWSQVLEKDRVSVAGKFFNTGGDSILAVRLLGMINHACSANLSLQDLYHHETVRDLAILLESESVDSNLSLLSKIEAELDAFDKEYKGLHADSNIEQAYPMSDIEKGMCFQSLKDPDSVIYFEQNVVPVLYKDFNISVFKKTLEMLVQKHPTLRTAFDLTAFAHVIYKKIETPLFHEDISDLNADEQIKVTEKYLEQNRRRHFKVSEAPLWRITIYKMGEDYHQMAFELHHAILDGWSYASFITELNNTYQSSLANEFHSLQPLAVSYKDIIIQELYQKQNEGTRTFWKTELEGFKKLDLGAISDKKEYHTVEKDYPLELLAKLEEASRKRNSKIKTLYFAAYLYAMKMLTYEDDLVVGLVSFNRPAKKDGEKLLGCFLNTIPARIKILPGLSWNEYVDLIDKKLQEIGKHDSLSLFEITQATGAETRTDNPFFETLFNFVNFHVFRNIDLDGQREPLSEVHDFGNFLRGDTLFDVVMEVSDKKINAKYHYTSNFISHEQFNKFLAYYEKIVNLLVDHGDRRINHFDIMSEEEQQQLLIKFNDTKFDYPATETVITQFEKQAASTPERQALVFNDVTLTYTELNKRVNQLAHTLREAYKIQPNQPVGLMCERSELMVIGLLAILKAGGAYVPIDPNYPSKRVEYIIEDSNLKLILSNKSLGDKIGSDQKVLFLEDAKNYSPQVENPRKVNTADDLCYMIYTSGSTGNPKGVIISHDNVINFFHAMSAKLPIDENDTLLALTSISFDISVLELIWTLCRGVEVVLHPSNFSFTNMNRYVTYQEEKMDLSLFFFSSYNNKMKEGKYNLLINSVKYADQAGFKAVWTPERHFHEFGGLFPNPSLTSAALAMVTQQIELRCGSVVSPLHDVLRIAEEWSVVDNLSNGRVGLSFASGWNPNDFALHEGIYEDRQRIMYEQIGEVKKLWRGESINRKNGFNKEIALKIYPKPVREELPIWVTAASSDKTFESAGAIGANVLTHLLGQDIDDLAKKIEIYRNARSASGHAGEGIVSLMLHAYVGESIEQAEEIAEQPFIEYLKSSVGLTKALYQEEGLDESLVSDEDKERVLKSAFKRYYKTSSLIGTVHTCEETLQKLKTIGVNEIACLVDFGIAEDTVLAGLENLKALKDRVSKSDKNLHRPVTVMQSTPSFVKLIEDSPGSNKFLKSLKKMLLGGEALPLTLIKNIRKKYDAQVFNMYGPTETTVWSCVHEFDKEIDQISIGKPILNTKIYILDKNLQPLPVGVAGDLYIGGRGVSKGYWHQEALTKFRFVSSPFEQDQIIYHTGDMAMWLYDGTLKFLGRHDHQIKINGHRIELGEIENKLLNHSMLKEVAVVQRENEGNKFLIAYFVPHKNKVIDVAEVREYIAKEIPDYMVPSYFVPLAKLPLTPNGKLDVKALPDFEVETSKDCMLPANDIEFKLRDIWAQILKIEADKISTDKSFFELGGHSLSGILLTNTMYKAFNMEFPLQELFAKPTIIHMAKYIESRLWLQRKNNEGEDKRKKELIV